MAHNIFSQTIWITDSDGFVTFYNKNLWMSCCFVLVHGSIGCALGLFFQDELVDWSNVAFACIVFQ